MFQSRQKQFLRILSVFIGLACLIWAQTETGQITGTVTDTSGAVVPNANITVTNTATGAARKTTTGSAGAYAATNLNPGQYEVKVELSGFSTFDQKVTVTVGSAVGLDAKLQIGNTGTVVQVAESAVRVNTETQTLSTNVSQTQLRELPTLTRDPYSLVAISGNVSSAGAGNRGVGFNINGQRQASTNVLLDGAANNNEFSATVGQSVPLDAVQEYSVLTNNFTAEYGRASGGVVNVVTKSGTNEFHGTAYEFNRVSALSSNDFKDNANSVKKSVFTRNQFGYSFGGPIKKDKLFFFSSTEWIRIRSVAHDQAYLPSDQFLALTSPNTQSFFNAYGKLKAGDTVLQSFSQNTFAAQGRSICGTNAACAALSPTLPIFNLVDYTANANAGGGTPQNQYQNVERVDYNINDRTQLYVRYALQSNLFFPGYASSSPYQGFDTGETDFNNNILLNVTRTITPSFLSQSKAVFNRLNSFQPLGPYGAAPTLYTGTSGALTIGNYSVYFPGYLPGSPGSGIPSGGPQNFVQLYQDFSYSRGKHEFRFGGSYDYIRDNRTFGAYETAGEYLGSGAGKSSTTVANLLSGSLYEFQAAIYPQGQLPGSTVNYPLTPPNFSRSNRYSEGAVYGQDSWKIVPRFTLNIGLRWEYYGVQHNKNPNLDSNFYDPSNQIDTPLGIRLGQVALAPTKGGLWQPDYHDFAPRVGFAWDLTGDGKTSLRGGYGIAYERNFGNVTFNVIQNPPNYETVQVLGATTPGGLSISPNNFGPFSQTTGSLKLPRASLRNVDSNIPTAFSHLYSVSLEHQISKSLVVGADYSGSRGVHLYDIEVLNRVGYGNVFLGDPCTITAAQIAAGNAGCLTYLNNQYSGINRRGSKGYSNYNALNFHANLNNMANSGVTLTFAYTWSHALDNLSSTFSDSNSFADNNGQFNTGYLDPYAPMLDKGSADFDIRHRVSVSAIWDIPAFKNRKGILGQVLGGWQLAPIFTARTGSPYSIFDGSNAFTDYPRAAFTTPVGPNSNSSTPTGARDTFNFLTFPASSVDHFRSPLYGYADLGPFPADMTGRNAFRAPGFFDLDLGVYKVFLLTERFRLQLRGEAYNIVNHANLYVNGGAADVANVSAITACYGCTGATADRRNLQLAVKLTF